VGDPAQERGRITFRAKTGTSLIVRKSSLHPLVLFAKSNRKTLPLLRIELFAASLRQLNPSRDGEPRERQSRQHHRDALVITHLALGEEQHDGPTMAVADGVQFRVQAAFGAADATRKSPFCSRLAAVRCAFRCVASIISRSGVSASAASAAKMRAKTPSRLQRIHPGSVALPTRWGL